MILQKFLHWRRHIITSSFILISAPVVLAPAFAQSFSITAPAASQSISGTYTATVAISGHPGAATVEWLKEGEAYDYENLATNPSGSWVFSSYIFGNGTEHHIGAVLLDAAHNTLATATPVEFTVLNTTPVNSQMTVSLSTNWNSTWSGIVQPTLTFTNSITPTGVNCAIDGIPVQTNYKEAYPYCSFFTTSFSNGVHNITIEAYYALYNGTDFPFASWEQQVTFSNSGGIELDVNSHNAWISPTGTYQIATPTIKNADGTITTLAANSAEYFVDSSVSGYNNSCTVNHSTGLVTGAGSGAFGLCPVWSMSTSTSPSLQVWASGTLPGAGIAASTPGTSQTIFLGGGCPGPNHPALILSGGIINFYVIIEPGTANEEVVGFQDYDCDANVGLGGGDAIRGELGTSAPSHAGGAPWIIAYQRETFLYVAPTNQIQNFTTSNSIVSNWQSNSIFLSTGFAALAGAVFSNNCGSAGAFSCNEAQLSNATSAVAWNQALNAMEFDAAPSAPTVGSGNEAAWDTSVQNYWNPSTGTLVGWLHAGGAHLRVHASLNSAMSGYPNLFPWMNSGYSTAPITYALQQAYNSGFDIGAWGCDECNAWWGSTPYPQDAITSGTYTMTGDGTTTTVTASADLGILYKGDYPQQHFAIFGASTPGLNCSVNATSGQCPSASSAGTYYLATATSGWSFTFPSSLCTMTSCGAGSNFTVNATTDSGLVIEPWADPWQTTSPYYVQHTVWTTVKTQLAAVSPKVPFSTPPLGGNDTLWLDPNSPSDFARVYGQGSSPQISPVRWSSYVNAETNMLNIRENWGEITTDRLLMPLMPSFTTNAWTVNDIGPSIPISSVDANGTFHFASPHGITTVLPGASRMIVSGSSISADNGQFFFNTAPTSTTATVSRRFPSSDPGCSSGCNGSWTATFLSDNTTAGVSTIWSSLTGTLGNSIVWTSATCAIQNHRGGYFTLSGPSLPTYFAGKTFWYASESSNCQNVGGAQSYAIWRETISSPACSSSCGSAIVMPDYGFHWGETSLYGGLRGNRYPFVMEMSALTGGASAFGLYDPGHNPNNYRQDGVPNGAALDANCNTYGAPFTGYGTSDPSGCPGTGAEQNGGHPVWEDGTGSVKMYQATVQEESLTQSIHVDKCLFQPRAAAPDFGLGLEATVREGAQSNCLMVQSNVDGVRSISVDPTPYETGQPGLEIIANSQAMMQMTTLASNAGTQNITLPEAGVLFIIFPVSGQPDSFAEPSLSFTLPTGATSAVVQWACNSPYALSGETNLLPNVVNTTTGSVTIPADENTCTTLYYRMVVLRHDSGSGEDIPLTPNAQPACMKFGNGVCVAGY